MQDRERQDKKDNNSFLSCRLRSCISLLIVCFAARHADANTDVQRINSHLIIDNCRSACSEAKDALKNNPNSQALWEVYIQALSKAGDEKEMVKAWKEYINLFPDQANNRLILENMAWGVIEKGMDSHSLITRLYSALGAFFGQDARGVDILYKGMHDDSGVIRGISVKLAGDLKDAKLKDKVLQLLVTEKNWNVRLEAILASGKMEIEKAEPLLIELLSNEHSSIEVKAAAFQALVYLLETPDRAEILHFATSDRADLRLLACKVIGHEEMYDDIDLIFPLTEDHHPGVRQEALYTLGILRSEKTEWVIPWVYDTNPQVAITAAWALTLQDPDRGQEAFRKWFQHSNNEVRRFAAAALSATGKYGYPLVTEVFQKTNDSYVKMNLALGMIGQRIMTKEATEALYKGFSSQTENWAWEENTPFKTLVPSKLKHKEIIPNYPESVNLATRLEILNILAMMNQPGLKEEIKTFLKRRTWGISGAASALLLTEGDESAIELVQKLLEEKDPKVKVQAALILSMWGGGDKAISTLLEAYQTGDRELKEMILESLGNIGSPSTIPFLIDRLGEPYATLRIIAASSLLKTLYH
jgi:HEAT repeat protein